MRVLTIEYTDLLLRKRAVREAMPADWTMHILFNTIQHTLHLAKGMCIPPKAKSVERLRASMIALDGDVNSVCFLYRGADVSAFSPKIMYFEPVSPKLNIGDTIDGRRVYEARVRVIGAPLDLREIYTSLLLRHRRGEWRVYYSGTVDDSSDTPMAILESVFSKF